MRSRGGPENIAEPSIFPDAELDEVPDSAVLGVVEDEAVSAWRELYRLCDRHRKWRPAVDPHFGVGRNLETDTRGLDGRVLQQTAQRRDPDRRDFNGFDLHAIGHEGARYEGESCGPHHASAPARFSRPGPSFGAWEGDGFVARRFEDISLP